MSDQPSNEAKSLEKPEEPADRGGAYDPSMTDRDEANIPPDSETDPNASDEAE
jgi:hypothetical protein